MKNFKIYAIVFVSVLIILSPGHISKSCSFFGGIPTSSDIEHIIYEVPESDTRRIKDFVTKDSIILPTELTTNSLVKYLRFTRESDFLDYLVFAKKCEPYVVRGVVWDEESGGDDSGIDSLLI